MRNLAAVLLSVILVGGCSALAESAPSAPPAPTAAAIASPTPTASPAQTATVAPAATPGATPSAAPSTGPTPVATPTPTPGPTLPPRAAYQVNLYRKGAFVSQLTDYFCLPAAMQTMINIMTDGPMDTTFETQDRLHTLARTFLIEPYSGKKGAQPEGWAEGLNAEGYGPFTVAVRPTRPEAIRLAAYQLRATGKPVGLLAWRGAHAWVMSGFKADADPLLFDDFNVTHVWIEDVWYPRVSSIWGESTPPDTLYAVEDLRVDFLRYNRPRHDYPDKDGQFVMIVPLLPEQTGV